MKKLFYPLSLLLLLSAQYGCESYHRDENREEQQEAQANNQGLQNDTQQPHVESEHGGNSGNR